VYASSFHRFYFVQQGRLRSAVSERPGVLVIRLNATCFLPVYSVRILPVLIAFLWNTVPQSFFGGGFKQRKQQERYGNPSVRRASI
jgi:hypothetical protein